MPPFNSSTKGKEVVEAFADRVSGKTILIKGPSKNGIGAETALSLATANPSTIFLLSRSLPKITPIDLVASLASVRKAAAEINGDVEVEKIDLIVNNAGIIAVPTYEVSRDGIEMQLASNHVGHFLLTNLLMGKLLKAGRARVVNVSSMRFELSEVRFEDWNFKNGKDYGPWQAYGQSKTANVLFAKGLAEKLKSRGIQAFSVQPGCHITPDMWTDVMQIVNERSNGNPTKFEDPKTAQQGCSTTLVAALDPSIEGESGAFLQDCAIRSIEQDYATSKENVDKLWTLSEKLVGQTFDL